MSPLRRKLIDGLNKATDLDALEDKIQSLYENNLDMPLKAKKDYEFTLAKIKSIKLERTMNKVLSLV